jgi:hypothetical protein
MVHLGGHFSNHKAWPNPTQKPHNMWWKLFYYNLMGWFKYGDILKTHPKMNTLPLYPKPCQWRVMCRNPSFGLGTKAKGLQECRPKKKVGSHITYSRECKKMWGNEPSHSQGNSHFGRWTPDGLPKLQRVIWRVKTQWFMALFISLESS